MLDDQLHRALPRLRLRHHAMPELLRANLPDHIAKHQVVFDDDDIHVRQRNVVIRPAQASAAASRVTTDYP